MDDVFDRVVAELEEAFRRLEEQVPPPVKEGYKDGFILRYVEQTPQQAMLQKFARLISGLHSLRLLLVSGFLQEMGVIQRTLDDFEEEILFITLAVANGDMTDHHKKYLEYHWIDEREETSANRGQVPRKHIRAYVAKHSGDDPSSMIAAGRIIYKGYSGFVHGNGESILDMCMTDPPRYLLAGMLESPLHSDHQHDLWNYMYRGLVASTYMARLFGDEALWNIRYCSLKEFEEAFGDMIF
ncbi:hypothetical protein PX699_07020 [Sphingobium sp. H39-3-25]|uniref:hypothetical protein n=1 Tax=Sphingobium arseniciresistens TaxID=3030834 RepID=UPI0023B975AE|nr:hypothetical protein [Sphingobium arseniciresistens]